jgi:hypothetical protein
VDAGISEISLIIAIFLKTNGQKLSTFTPLNITKTETECLLEKNPKYSLAITAYYY